MMRTDAALAFGLLAFTLTGCRGDPKTPEFWEKQLNAAHHSKDRVRVVDDLRESGALSTAFLPMLHAHLASDKQSEVKGAIARLLGVLKDHASLEPLTNALDFGNTDSASSAMNKEIAAALARIGDPSSVPVLMRLLKSRDNYVRIEAINALGALKAKSAVDALIDIAQDEQGEPFISKKAIQALGEIGDPKAVPTLVHTLFKERRGVSFYGESSYALFEIGKPAADSVVALAKGDDKATWNWVKQNSIVEPAVYAKAAQLLGDLHDTRANKALIEQLGFNSEYMDLRLAVRTKAADALGRLRAAEAVKPLSGLLDEDLAGAREIYVHALVDIGGRDAIPALIKAAGKGGWEAREKAFAGLALLGDEREASAFDKALKEEDKLTKAECKDNDEYESCKRPDELAKKHEDVIKAYAKRLDAGKDCKTAVTCWAKKLDDPDTSIRTRAALELGRSGSSDALTALLQHLREGNLETRSAIIQGADWLVVENKAAAKAARPTLTVIDQQLDEEKSKTEFVKVNEDLKRLEVDLRRAG